MTLRNEIFEGLGAATAAQKLVYDPHDDYYEQVAQAAKRENQRRAKQDAEFDKNTADAKARARGTAGSAAPAGVPTAASTQTPQQPTVPTAAAPDQASAFPTAGGGYGLPPNLTPSFVDPPAFRAARGGAIKLRYRAGGPVTPGAPDDDDDDDESPEAPDVPRMQPMPHVQRRGQGGGGTPRNPKLSFRPDDPALIRKPWTDDEPWEGAWEGSPEDDPDFDYGTPRHPHAFQQGGEVDGDNPADKLVQQFLAQSGADILLNKQRKYGMENAAGVSDYDNRAAPLPPTEEEQRIRDEAQPNSRTRVGVLPVPPPPAASVEGSPVIPQPYPDRRVTGLDETGVEGSPNIVPPLAAYKPRSVTGQDDTYAPEGVAPPPRRAGADDESRIADEGAPNARARRPSSVPPAGRNEVDETELSGIPRGRRVEQAVETGVPAAPGMDNAQPYAPIDPRTTVGSAARSLFPPTSSPPSPSEPVGAGAGMGAGTQQAAAAPGRSGPTGTTTPAAPPTGAGAANSPSTAPKAGEGYQRFQPTKRTAMRPDAPDWNPLGVPDAALRPAPRPAGGGGAPAGPPARLGMSDPNRTDAFDPTPGGPDMADPTRRHTNTELAEALVGGAKAMPLGPNGELPPVGSGALSRPVGQQLVQAYNQGGRLEPGEAVLAGMMAGYRTLLSQNRVAEANSMASAVMQYANIEAASHAYVAADRVRAGDFLGALQGVAAAATWLPDDMKHEVGPDGKSLITRDHTGKVTAVTPVDGRWLLAAIEGFKNGDLLWQTLQSAADHLKGGTDKNAEGRELGKEIQRNTIKLQQQRLGKGMAGPKGPAQVTDLERRAAEILHNLGGTSPTAPTQVAQVAQGDNIEPDPAAQYSTGYDYNQVAPG